MGKSILGRENIVHTHKQGPKQHKCLGSFESLIQACQGHKGYEVAVGEEVGNLPCELVTAFGLGIIPQDPSSDKLQ